MCSSANYVLPQRRTCEALATPSRFCGGLTTNYPSPQSHGASQDSEIDMAWQELMAITELQEFDAPNADNYDTTQFQAIEPTGVPLGGYGMVQPYSEPLPGSCERSAAPTYGCFSAEMPVLNRLGNSAETMYGLSESDVNQGMLPSTSQVQHSITGLTEQIGPLGINHGNRRANAGFPQVISLHMLWKAHGNGSPTQTTDDLESDSGLSLGSSPPLASPENAAGSGTRYHSMGMGTSNIDEQDCTAGHNRSAVNQFSEYPYQSHPYLHNTYFQPHINLSSQPNPSKHSPAKLAQSTCNIFGDTVLPSRGSSQQLYTRPQGNLSSPLSRDEKRALAMKIPLPMEKIINLPVDDFNELLTQYSLTDTQLALVRDIRRRGKNKVAAQNCRKRKLESIIHLETELGQLQARRENLAQERLEFQRSLAFMKARLRELYALVFSHLRDENGQPYSVNEYSLQQTPDGKIYLVPSTTIQKRDQC